jgi:uncharacterized repeat protein (TIGR02543 family)
MKAWQTHVLAYFALATQYSWAAPELKFPFSPGESWKLTRGYNNNANVGTHVGKDAYALDFNLPDCKAWHMPALAAAPGIAYIKGNRNDTSSYGLYVDIDHGDGYVTRYAHLDETSIVNGVFVRQGQQIGKIGNSGYFESSVTCEHPGTHIHFAVYYKGEAYKPEPISGKYDLTEGLFYLSTNIDPWTTSNFIETDSFCKLYNPNPFVERFRNSTSGSLVITMTPSDGKIYYYANRPACDLAYYPAYYGDDVGGYTPPIGTPPESIPGKRTDLRPDFDIDDESGNEISANCNSCSTKPVHPGQRIRLRLQTQVANADAEGYKRDSGSDTIEGPIWWKIEGKTGWRLLASGEYTISKLDKDAEITETHEWNVPNYPGDVLALKACVDGDDEISEEGESDGGGKDIDNPDQGGTANNCSRTERFYIQPPNYPPTGAIESGDCSKITGWAKDQNTTSSLLVQVSVANLDGTNAQYLETLVANDYRADLGGYYGLEWNPPDSLKDGQPKKVIFSAVNIPEGPNPVIGSVPLTCTSNAAIISTITNLLLADNELKVVVQGGGRVVSSPAGINCPRTCNASFSEPGVTLTAKPNTGYQFAGWINACSQTKMNTVCKLNLTADKTVTAVFKRQ